MRRNILFVLILMATGATALWSQALQDQSAAGELDQAATESLGRNTRIYGEMQDAPSTPQVGGVTVSGTLDFTIANTFTRSDNEKETPVANPDGTLETTTDALGTPSATGRKTKTYDGLPGYAVDLNDAVFNITSYVSDWSKVTMGLGGSNIVNTKASPAVLINSFTIDSFVLREAGLLSDQATNPLSLLLSTGYRDFGVQGYSGGGTESGGAEVHSAELPKGLLFRATPAYLLGNGDFIALDVATYGDWLGAKADDADYTAVEIREVIFPGPLVLLDLYGQFAGYNVEAYYATRNKVGATFAEATKPVGGFLSPINSIGFAGNGEVLPNWTLTFGYDFIPAVKDKIFTLPEDRLIPTPDNPKTTVDESEKATTIVTANPTPKLSFFGRQAIGLGTGYTQTVSTGTGFMNQDVYWRAGLSGNTKISIGDTIGGQDGLYFYNKEGEADPVYYNETSLKLAGRYMHGAFGLAGGFAVSDLDLALNAKDLGKGADGKDQTFNDYSGFEIAFVAELQGFTIFTGWVSKGGDINASLDPAGATSPYGSFANITDKDGVAAPGAVFFRMIASF